MYKYMICDVADEEIYKKQVNAIIKKFSPIKNIVSDPIDVDGSTKTRVLVNNSDYVDIINDAIIDYVAIESTIDLEKVFGV